MPSSSKICKDIEKILTEKNAQDIVSIDLKGKSALADYMIIVSGSNRTHLGALANHIALYAKKQGMKSHGIEGSTESSWVIIDIGDIIIHIFMPETRTLYDLESMWLTPIPTDSTKVEKTKA